MDNFVSGYECKLLLSAAIMVLNYRKSVSDPMYSILILSYVVVGFLAVLGNTGVIFAFCRSVILI